MIQRSLNSPLSDLIQDGSEPASGFGVAGRTDEPPGSGGARPSVLVETFHPRSGDAGTAPPELPLILPHTFYSTERRADPNRNTIVCDGGGDIDVQLRPGTPACIKECVTEHEYKHRQDALERDPKVCEGKPKGTEVGVPPAAEKAVELRGYDIELRCLQDELRKAKPECQPVVKDRIETVKHEIQKRKP